MNILTYLIVCPMLFLAGFVDSIAGGGGLISLPAYILAGLPIHNAIATNKLSSTCGTTLSLVRFIRNRLIDLRMAIPSVVAGVAGSFIGARLSLLIPETFLKNLLLFVLPVSAFMVLNHKIFKDNGGDQAEITAKTLVIIILSSFIIGTYDGLYGPGTGTFIIIAFTVFAKMGIASANAHCKAINTATNVTALIIFILNGNIWISLGLAAAVFNMLGNYVGSYLAIKQSTRITKPLIIVVLILLFIKILTGF